MNKFYSAFIIFLMGFLFTYTPAPIFLNSIINFGDLLKNVVDLLGIIMMLFGAYQCISIWFSDKK
ncbi:hypothetical protein D3C85_1366230 [compost metagenome]